MTTQRKSSGTVVENKIVSDVNRSITNEFGSRSTDNYEDEDVVSKFYILMT